MDHGAAGAWKESRSEEQHGVAIYRRIEEAAWIRRLRDDLGLQGGVACDEFQGCGSPGGRLGAVGACEMCFRAVGALLRNWPWGPILGAMGAKGGHCAPADMGPGEVMAQENDFKAREVNVEVPAIEDSSSYRVATL